jgi:serine/threonine protein kinase/Tol biopolymer transport system component
MSLTTGTRMGPYEIAAPLGAGGMGEVYRAHDARLGREVAIKVLPSSLAADTERLRRFEQEARATGALNHPNILGVYDIGSHGGAPYVVSELLEGETLRARIGASPLPRRKTVDYATQLAKGLAAAHDKGIVHRDLKPDNVFVTRDGRVKILDFGLAKLTEHRAAIEAETALLAHAGPLTSAGMVLGTVGYMSPEQVRGQAVDHRSDIFSFGVVLYEMLTGRRAFQGDSAVETMNAILKEDPAPVAGSGEPLPPALDRIVLHCLEKNPEERFQSARDIAFDLESLSGLSTQSVAEAPRPPRRRWLRLAALAALTAAVGAGLFVAGLFVAGRLTGGGSGLTFEPLTFRRGSISSARFAPDGHTIVFAANFDGSQLEIYSAQPGSPESRPLGVKADLQAVSRHGELAVLLERPGRGAVLARLPLGGGAPREVLENVRSADWAPDGESLAVVRAEGERDTLEFPIGHVLYQGHGWLSDVSVSPRGDRVAFFEHPVDFDARGDVAVVDLAGKKTTISAGWEDLFGTHWTPAGDEVWFSASGGGGKSAGTDHAVFAATLSGRLRTVVSAPGSLELEDIAPDGRVLLAHGSRRPSMMALAPGATDETELTWMDFSWIADIPSDGRRVLFTEMGVAGGPGYAAYLRGMDRSPAIRLGKGFAQSLSPDGRWALAIDLVNSALVVLPTGAGEPRTLPRHGLKAFSWAGWFPDGKRILFAGFEEGKGQRMYVQDVSGGPPRPITPEGVFLRANTLTPDGGWVAERAKDELVQFRVDANGTGEPQPVKGADSQDIPLRWSGDGRMLFVRQGRLPARIFALNVASGARTFVREVSPRDTVGVDAVVDIRLTPDAKSYAYVYIRSLYSLYQVTGLK